MKRFYKKNGSLFFLFAVLFLFLSSCAFQQRAKEYRMTDTAMGTIIQETIYVRQENNKDSKLLNSYTGQEILEEIIKQIRLLESEKLSWRMDTSEIYKINQTKGKAEGYILSKELEETLESIWQVSQASEGALDITIGEAVQLWDIDSYAAGTKTDFQLPSSADIAKALEHTGYEKVRLEGSQIWLPEEMNLDLGAVGKGIACNVLADYLRQQKEIEGAVISVGGSIVTYGKKPDNTLWKVGIVHPRDTDRSFGYLTLEGEWYLSTSGDYERYVEADGVRYHHILNPKTGYPADSDVCSVTILCKNGLLSDALSTACFILGREKGSKLAEDFQAYALFIDKEGNSYMTEGMEKFFTKAE